MRTCTNCKALIRDNDIYCRNCGFKIQSNIKSIILNIVIVVTILALVLLLILFITSYLFI